MSEETVNISALPADVQAYIAGEVAKALAEAEAAKNPQAAPPTAEEKIEEAIAEAKRSERQVGQHDGIVAALTAIFEYVRKDGVVA